jgi:hypothetical protein
MMLPDDRSGPQVAAWIGQVFPRWYVTWGAYSRELWAYPLFDVPEGTIVHAADPTELTRLMRAIERSAQ